MFFRRLCKIIGTSCQYTFLSALVGITTPFVLAIAIGMAEGAEIIDSQDFG